jgi:hypothetical protein
VRASGRAAVRRRWTSHMPAVKETRRKRERSGEVDGRWSCIVTGVVDGGTVDDDAHQVEGLVEALRSIGEGGEECGVALTCERQWCDRQTMRVVMIECGSVQVERALPVLTSFSAAQPRLCPLSVGTTYIR